MKRLLLCKFNIDTGCVKLKYSDWTVLSINCTVIIAEIAKRFMIFPISVTSKARFYILYRPPDYQIKLIILYVIFIYFTYANITVENQNPVIDCLNDL